VSKVIVNIYESVAYDLLYAMQVFPGCYFVCQ